ncbi:DUF2179 domain-containing protein [candidate division KSB1 bacterium]|nr:DUF2179 domain-containing protein [candidate division KSB1 bacterium]
MNDTLFNWVILPLLIFMARILDVSMGTLRITFVSRGKKLLASILGFFEVLVWLLAIREIFNNLNNVACYLAYASGFASGSYVGMWIEQKLALGLQVLRIITRTDAEKLVSKLRTDGYGITVVDGVGKEGPVKVIFSVIPRKELKHIIQTISQYNPLAFFSIEDVRMVAAGIFPTHHWAGSNKLWNFFKMNRK